jgi:hypothetical protein
MPNYSGEYQGGKRQTCILYEGAITITTTGKHYAGGTNYLNSWAAATELEKGDYVGLHLDTGNTFLACRGVPVVTAIAAAVPIIGRIVTEPEWQIMPATTTATWAADLAREGYRTAVVEMMNVTAIHAALVEGTAAIEVGAPLAWDISMGAYKDNGTARTGAFCFHYTADAGPANALIGFAGHGVASGNTDFVGIDVVA